MAAFWQVGGSVRDELLGIPSKDIDFAVEAESFADMREAILARKGKIFLETERYLTIRANVPGLGATDYTLCRKDGAYHDGRHPEEVTVGTILDDLARRDFTVNAIAKGEDGVLLDPHGGVEDLKAKRLRCVGDPEERFTEDGLRMLRAIRFCITKGLTPDISIIRLFSDGNFYGSRFQGVSVERVREELVKCFSHNTFETLNHVRVFDGFFRFLFRTYGELWLKPTLEAR